MGTRRKRENAACERKIEREVIFSSAVFLVYFPVRRHMPAGIDARRLSDRQPWNVYRWFRTEGVCEGDGKRGNVARFSLGSGAYMYTLHRYAYVARMRPTGLWSDFLRGARASETCDRLANSCTKAISPGDDGDLVFCLVVQHPDLTQSVHAAWCFAPQCVASSISRNEIRS